MPGGSIAPILAAFGGFSLFIGLVFGGVVLVVGATILVLMLLVWLREGMRDYGHLEPATTLPAVVHEGPPPGVHMPGPSIRPLLGALGAFAVMAGLVFGGWILLLAAIFLAWTLVGWLVDFKAEYRKVEEADMTGHLENIPDRRWPMTALQAFVVLFVVVAIFQAGLLNGIGNAAAPGASGSPSASGGAGGSGGSADLTVIAKDIAFNTHDLSATAGKSFTIDFQNQDPSSIPHNIQIQDSSGTVVQDQSTINGGQSVVYTFNALQPGTYKFICKVHPIPSMTGTLTVK
jgi:plastocyanin